MVGSRQSQTYYGYTSNKQFTFHFCLRLLTGLCYTHIEESRTSEMQLLSSELIDSIKIDYTLQRCTYSMIVKSRPDSCNRATEVTLSGSKQPFCFYVVAKAHAVTRDLWQ